MLHSSSYYDGRLSTWQSGDNQPNASPLLLIVGFAEQTLHTKPREFEVALDDKACFTKYFHIYTLLPTN